MKKVYFGLNLFFSFFKKGIMRFVLSLITLTFLNSSESFGQQTYDWVPAGAADWTVAANWSPSRGTPAANDILRFNNGTVTTPINIPTQTIGQLSVSANTTVNLQGAAAGTILTISGLAAGDDLTVGTGSALNINVAANTTTLFVGTGATGLITGNMTFSNAAHKLNAADANGIIFNSPAVFTQDLLCTGNVFTAAGTNSAIIFNTGTTFIQNAGANPFAVTQPASKVLFNTGNLYIFQIPSGTPSFSGRTYANFQFNGSGTPATSTGGNPVSINNFSVTSGTINVNMTAAPGHSIKGNISVSAGATLNFNPAAAGTINLNGTAVQSITNAGILTFGSNQAVTINNSAGITLNSDITVNSLVTFTAGVVTAPNPRMLIFSSTATVAPGVTNASYVDGMVKKFGNSDFEFPVGKIAKGYVPLAISLFVNGAATDEFVAEYIRGSARALGPVNAGAGLVRVSACDYWILNKISASPTLTLDVTGFWNTNNPCLATPYIDDETRVTLAHFGGVDWDSYAVSPILGVGSNSVSGSVKWTSVSTFSPFSLASTSFGSNPLPINLNYLNGIKQGNNNVLNWKVTCTNNPNATMSVERSADARNYTSITTVFADALRCQQPFDFTDNNPPAGLNYYRLKMVDANGKITYSAPIAILNKETGFDMVGLSPTLVNTKTELNVTAAQKTTMTVVITDVAGKQVQKMLYNLIAGSNKFTVNATGLSAGTYQITGYTADGKSRTIRFVKQ
jgi:hypothetical protein